MARPADWHPRSRWLRMAVIAGRQRRAHAASHPPDDAGQVAPFVVSLLPEGWLESVLNDRDERAMLRSGRRYMSNITKAENAGELAALPLDVLATTLASDTQQSGSQACSPAPMPGRFTARWS